MYRRATVGAVITAALLLTPVPYPYAPVLGALAAAVVFRGEALGAGMIQGAAMGPLGAVLAIVAVTVPVPPDRGVMVVLAEMSGVGPRNVVFYAVFVSFLSVYTGLAATLTNVVTDRLRTAIRARLSRGRSET